MKSVDDFETFLLEEVNLNTSRITKLKEHVESIEDFLNGSNWGPTILRYSAQGSWAHKTIIKPPGSQGFDADLVVYINPVSDWTPEDYIFQLRRVFKESRIYKEKVSLRTRCVTVSYAGDFDIDVVPCVVGRIVGGAAHEVCNRVDDDFEATAPEAYTAWLEERNAWVGSDRLREVIRLLKYLRDIKVTFSCKSILLTTLIAERVTLLDALLQTSDFSDLPTALRTLTGRLDVYLQDRPNLPNVCNPVLQEENFTRHWNDDQYANFRELFHRYREWIDEAYVEPDEAKSQVKWQRIFGDEFGKLLQKSVVKFEETSLVPVPAGDPRARDAVQIVQLVGPQILAHVPQSVPWMKPTPWRSTADTPVLIRTTAHHDRTGNRPIGTIQSGEILRKGLQLRFEAVAATGISFAGKDQQVQWQVVNSDQDAWNEDGLRGGFYRSDPPAVRWETTRYRGVHWVQAFVIRKRDMSCIGRSVRFFVVIE